MGGAEARGVAAVFTLADHASHGDKAGRIVPRQSQLLSHQAVTGQADVAGEQTRTMAALGDTVRGFVGRRRLAESSTVQLAVL